MEEPVAPIPKEWAKAVSSILNEGDRTKIVWTERAMLEWQAATMSVFAYEAQDSIAKALSVPLLGRRVPLSEPGESYEFMFMHEAILLYAKICLRPSGSEIKIISTHVPFRGPEL